MSSLRSVERVQREGVSTSEFLESLEDHFHGYSVGFYTICRDVWERVLGKLFPSKVCESTRYVWIFGKWGFIIQICNILIVSKTIIISCLGERKLYYRTT